MIIDCFPFYNEFDLLDVRLNELRDVVDVFVLSEATRTFRNKPKPLYFDQAKDRYKEFDIEHIIIDSYDGIDPDKHKTMMDLGQKHKALNIMMERVGPQKDDMLIISDCDEIPRAEVVRQVAQDSTWEAIMPMMPLYYYYFNHVCTSMKWRGGKWYRYNGRRLKHRRYKNADRRVKNAGWHFSYFDDAEGIRQKIGSISHIEFDCPPYNTIEHIEGKLRDGGDLFDRGRYRFEITEDMSGLPQYVQDNMDRFDRYICRN